MNDLSVSHRTFIRSSAVEVYRKLTCGTGWEKWFASSASIGGAPGDPIHFRWDDFGVDHYTAEDQGVVVVLEEPTAFSFTWHPGAYETQVNLRFEALADGCVLSVNETGHRFASDAERQLALSVATGWGEALTLFKFFVEAGAIYGPVPANY